MKKYIFLFATFFLIEINLFAQIPTYQMSDQTVTGICTGIFTDSDAGTGLFDPNSYGNNESFIITFCSGSSEPMTFIFSSLDIGSGDHLVVFDGPNTSSPILYDLSNTNPGSLTIISTGTCLTFWFTSDGSGSLLTPNGNWAAYFECGLINPPEVAADDCVNAPTICNLDGYFGNTSSSYTPDEPGNMCQSCGLFGGSLENNSWLNFIPNNDTVIFTITLLTCSDDIGIQFGVYSGTNCNNFVLMTPATWTSSSAPITPGSVSTIVATNLIPGQVYYIMIDGNAGDDCQYIINAQSGIQMGATISPDQSICPGESATVEIATSSSIPVTWTSNPIDPDLVGQEHNTSITVSPTATTIYAVYVQDSAGFCTIDSTLYTTVTVLPFNDPACLTGLNCTIVKTDATTCPVPPNNTCDGTATVNVVGGTGSYVYSWNDGNTSSTRNNLCAGSYSVTVSDPGSSLSPTSCSVTILGPEAPTYTYTTSNSCQNIGNGAIDLTITSGVPPYSFHWSNNASTEDLTNVASGSYSVTITDHGSCLSYATISVGTLPSPPVNFTATGTGCSPVTAYFHDITADSIVDWHWVLSDGTIVNDSSEFSHIFTATTQVETYAATLTVTNGEGCTAEMIINNAVTVYPVPVATITADPIIAYINEPITFTGSGGYAINTWGWNFDYPNSGYEPYTTNPTDHSYPSEGVYTVHLIVTNSGGCNDTASIQVEVIDIYIPNIFTPNSDGFNDFFEIKNIEKLKNTNVTIYNRWGKKILDADDYKNDWDGKNHADGTYYYIINLGGESSFHGTVTIVR